MVLAALAAAHRDARRNQRRKRRRLDGRPADQQERDSGENPSHQICPPEEYTRNLNLEITLSGFRCNPASLQPAIAFQTK